MKTFYFIASVVNATARDVRVIGAGDTAREAFASAAIMLSNGRLECHSLQRVTEAQYRAAISAPLWADVDSVADLAAHNLKAICSA